jgi:putative transposase
LYVPPDAQEPVNRAAEAADHRASSSQLKPQPPECPLKRGQDQGLALAACNLGPGLVHDSNPGSQYYPVDYQALFRKCGILDLMILRGNCHENAVAESFFDLLKRDWIRRRTYRTREEARHDVFDYIKIFYNLKRKRNGMLLPIDYERQQKLKHESV